MTYSSDYKYAVCCWSTPKNTVFDDIEQCAAIGAAAGLWERKFGPELDDEVEEALARHGVQAGILVPDNWTILPTPLNPAAATSGWREISEGIAASARRLARFKPVGLLVGPGVSGDPAVRAGPLEDVVEGLKVIADAAGEVGMRIGFEPYARRRGGALVTLAETMDVIEKAGRPNVDLLPDVWHYWPEPDTHRELAQYVDRIMGLQVNDPRVDERSWCDRAQPGDGRNECVGMVAALIEAGFEGWYDYEVFSDDGRWGNDYPDSLWKAPHEVMLREGREKFDRVFREAKAMVAARANA